MRGCPTLLFAALLAGWGGAADLPDGAIRRLGTTDLRHGGTLEFAVGFAISPDGKQAATVADHRVRLWDLSNRQVAGEAELPEKTGLTTEVERKIAPAEFGLHERHTAWSPDGRSLVVAWRGALYRCSIPLAAPTRLPLPEKELGVAAFGFAAGELFALATDGTLHHYRSKSNDWERQDLPTVERAKLGLVPYCFAVGGNVVAVGGEGQARVWNATDRKLYGTVEVAGPVNGLTISADGSRLLVCAGRDKNGVELVSLPGLKRQLDPEKQAFRFAALIVAFSPDGSWLACAAGEGTPQRDRVRMFETATGKEAFTLTARGEHFLRLAFTSDGSQLLALGSEGVIHRWDTKTGKAVDPAFGHRGVVSVTVALKGGRVLTGGRDCTAILWDADGKEVWRTSGHIRAVTGLALSPDEKTLFSSSFDNSVRVWDMADGKELRTKQLPLEPGLRGLEGIAVSADGKTVAVGSHSGIRLLDTETLAQQDRLSVPDDPKGSDNNFARAVRFLPDGRIASRLMGREIRVWDVGDRAIVREFGSPDFRFPNARSDARVPIPLAVSPDGKTVAVWIFRKPLRRPLQSGVGFWDLATGKEIGLVELGADAAPGPITFTPDGKSVIAGDEKNARLWLVDVEGKKVVKKFDTGRHFPRSLAVFPDGKAFVSGGTDTTALVWKLDAK